MADVLLQLLPPLLDEFSSLAVERALFGKRDFLPRKDRRHLSMEVCKVRVSTVHVPLVLTDVAVDLVHVVRLGPLAAQERSGYPDVDVRVLARN